MTYVVGSTTSPAGVTAISSGVLQQYGPPTAVNGREYFMGLSSSYGYPYNSATLKSNSGVVIWSFNIRTNRTSSSFGFDAATYGATVILATNNADPTNAGANGYAVVLRKNVTASNAVTLVRFAGGLTANANTTPIIGPSPDLGGATPAYTNYASVKVVYTPFTDTWQLFFRDDAGTASVDPLSGTLTQVGVDVVNPLYTSSASYANFGFFYNHSTATSASNKAMFDNFKVQVNVPVTWTSGWPKAESPTPTGFTAKVNANVAGTSYYVVLANGATAPSSAQVKAGQDASSAAATASGSIACAAGSTEYSAAAGGSLANSTTYDVYFVAQDASGSNLQASPVMVTVTTTGSANAPLIQDPTATGITNSLATLGGNITSDGGSALTERGTVWNTITGVSISDNKLADGLTATGIFTQSRTSFPAKTHIFFKAFATNTIGTTLTSEGNFYTKADEPTAQVTDFTAAASSPTSIDLTWTAAAGTDGYFILLRQSSAAPSGVPLDATVYPIGTTLGLGSVAAYVTSGATTAITLSGLLSNSIYTLRIMSVNSDGVNAATYNYFTTAGPTATATTLIPPTVTYTWNQTGTASWATASNWTPTRTTPEIKDILQFNGGGNIVVTDVPNQTIGQLLVSNNTNLELQSTATITLNLSGEAGFDFDIPAGSSLTISQATNGITIALAAGSTGNIGGTITYSNAAHQLTALNGSGITFQNGSVFTAGTLFIGNAFGTTNLNSVKFQSGSTYIQNAGSNPFGSAQPNSVVTFETGSLYKFTATIGGPSYSGRTYSNFENDSPSSTQNNQGSSPFTCDNYTVTSGIVNWDFTGGIFVKGNISVSSAATLTFGKASKVTNLTLSGTSEQTISGTGFMDFGALGTLIVNNPAGATLNTNATLFNLTVTSGIFKVVSGASLITSGTVTGNVTVERTFASGSDAWHLFCLPTSSGFNASPLFDGAYVDAYSENTGAWNRLLTANSIDPKTGYSVNFPSGSHTLAFSGAVNTGDQSFSGLSYTTGAPGYGAGWHLIGNPFPSAVDLDLGTWTKTNLDGYVYVWDGAQYVCGPTSTGGLSTLTDNVIPAMQGFFVKASSDAAGIVIPQASRVHSSTFYKNAQLSANAIYLNINGNGYEDKAIVAFNPLSTAGFDSDYDAYKLYGKTEAPQLYSILPAEKAAVNTLPSYTTNELVPLGLKVGAATSYTLTAEGMDSFDPALPIRLDDLKLGTSIDLRLNPVYSFTSAPGDTENRFRLRFASATGVDEQSALGLHTWATNGEIHIILDAPSTGKAFLYNVAGQLVATAPLNSGETLLSTIASGVYMVKVITGRATTTQKVVVTQL